MSLSENPWFSQDFPSELPFLSGLFHLIPKCPTHSFNLIVEIVDRSVKHVGIGLFPNEYVWKVDCCFWGHRKVLSTSQMKQIIGAIYVLNKVRCRTALHKKSEGIWRDHRHVQAGRKTQMAPGEIFISCWEATLLQWIALPKIEPWFAEATKFEESWARNLRNMPQSHLRVGWTFSCTQNYQKGLYFARKEPWTAVLCPGDL